MAASGGWSLSLHIGAHILPDVLWPNCFGDTMHTHSPKEKKRKDKPGRFTMGWPSAQAFRCDSVTRIFRPRIHARHGQSNNTRARLSVITHWCRIAAAAPDPANGKLVKAQPAEAAVHLKIFDFFF
jgi:hypothetical protein